MSFEKSFARLEEILEKISSGKASLDESLTLYEEAEKHIASCGMRLQEAEEKIEILIKNREGKLAVKADNTPETANFEPQE